MRLFPECYLILAAIIELSFSECFSLQNVTSSKNKLKIASLSHSHGSPTQIKSADKALISLSVCRKDIRMHVPRLTIKQAKTNPDRS